ncbi:MAG: aminotransferase class I/II-fold pyridoxal phosphate-dependent enzyme [Chloroflexota bacterium]
MSQPYSQRIGRLFGVVAPLFQFMSQAAQERRTGDPDICDFLLGDPHEMPLSEFSDALQRWSVPQNKDWFAYTMNEHGSRVVIADSLRARRGIAFEPQDIFLTNGAFAALTVALNTVLDPGDEAIFISPPWFFYEVMIAATGATPVRVKINPQSFDLDLDAIAAAITPNTRAIIVNSPHNPTGVIYQPPTLERLAQILSEASARHGRTIYLLSDEAYSRVVFAGNAYHSPTAFYPNSFMIYTYGKQLLTPGQRLGYIALPPATRRMAPDGMPQREMLRNAIFLSQALTGYAFPNALLQHALPDIENLSIDLTHLQAKRDRMVGALREMGYDVNVPQGTFYLLARSPLADDAAFVQRLKERNVFCLPGYVFEMPGFFRISLTANDEMIERALPIFGAVMNEAQARA